MLKIITNKWQVLQKEWNGSYVKPLISKGATITKNIYLLSKKEIVYWVIKIREGKAVGKSVAK